MRRILFSFGSGFGHLNCPLALGTWRLWPPALTMPPSCCALLTRPRRATENANRPTMPKKKEKNVQQFNRTLFGWKDGEKRSPEHFAYKSRLAAVSRSFCTPLKKSLSIKTIKINTYKHLKWHSSSPLSRLSTSGSKYPMRVGQLGQL